ncbi:hypothetical protein SKAU_G00103540 [Synaphobranchus kaupii]|uniref:Uncharacterized protein n=1 Tax=Synaphobranchus kaupii TaxID=118154 RepID=A0A9Q1G009_SYNKA|nr:hypothetical protein SKAU_G00103540 [Synaphobranchus kaupii]
MANSSGLTSGLSWVKGLFLWLGCEPLIPCRAQQLRRPPTAWLCGANAEGRGCKQALGPKRADEGRPGALISQGGESSAKGKASSTPLSDDTRP